jgi:hypothetical protein
MKNFGIWYDMSLELEEIQKYLPQFLSAVSTEDLFSCLNDFPLNMDSRFYSDIAYRMEVIQGDGLDCLCFIDFDSHKIHENLAMVLSNSCDISFDNQRYETPSIIYCPLISFDKYIQSHPKASQSLLARKIKSQRYSSLFYLPKGQGLNEEKIAALDKIQSCPNNAKTRLAARKIFSLSNYGFYLFLLKLSIHFTRIRDGVDRK